MSSADAPDWSPRWYLWDGGFLAVGRVDVDVPSHAHHAVQISLAVAGTVAFRGAEGDWQQYGGAIIRPDAVHAYRSQDAAGALLFVDPESAEGLWLRAALTAPITRIPEARLEACRGELRSFVERPLEALDPGALVRHCVRALCAGAPPSRKLDPRVAGVLRNLHAAPDLRISLEEAAASVFLSAGRFQHLFREHVGLAFRRYVLWRKLTRALVAHGRGRNLAQAAQEGGFADGAHLTRTCTQMFGIPPSAMLRGEFFEIPPPFAPVAA